MGKRKFKKPDDSDSEYEWEEAIPKKLKSPEIVRNDNELSGFLDLYTTKSAKDIRNEKKQEEKEKDEKLMKDRMCVQEKVESHHIDSNWLKRVYNRMREQSEQTGEDLFSLLRERYDEKTIDMMMKLSGGRRPRLSKRESETRRSHDDHKYERPVLKDEDVTKDVEERHVTNIDLNEAAASMIKAEMAGNLHKVAKLRKKLDILREAQRRNLKIRLTKPRKDNVPEDRSVMIEKQLKSGRMVPYIETGNKFRSEIDRLVREEDATNADENDWAFASMAGRTTSHKSRYEDTGEREYDGVLEPKTRRPNKKADGDKHAAIAAHKRRTAQVSDCKRCYKGLPKHLVLSKGDYFCLVVPPDLGITDCHWQLIPLDHVTASTRLADDDAWAELAAFKTRIVEFCSRELLAEVVFMETALGVSGGSGQRHMVIECVPLTKSRDSYQIDNRVFFKKAIEEAKSEWCQNKKLIELTRGGDVRRVVPRELPYFVVEFDNRAGQGLAVVIDDERKFSELFGLEIVGSLLGKNEIDIRARKERSFNEQADVVLRAEKRWKSYDLWKRADTDDESE